MTDTKQPEALRLDALTNRRYPEHCRTSCSDADPCNYDIDGTGCKRCNAFFFARAEANEARIAELESENRALKEQEEAIGAGGVTGLRSNEAKDAARYRWLRNESWAGYNCSKGKPEVALVAVSCDGAGNIRTILAEEAMDEALDAAIAQEGGK